MITMTFLGLKTKRTHGKYFSPSKNNSKLAVMKAVKHHDLHTHSHTKTPQIS